MKTISTHTFKYTLRDIHKNTQNRKFCFVLGAGASVKSGIPSGGQLAEQWFNEIAERSEEVDFKQWINDQNIDETDLASSYGSIYRKRFENDKTSGYEFLVQAMKSAAPSFGHIVLAQILSRTSGHCVVTTNFDSLVESSVYQFTNKTPLVCGHESLSGYARPSQTHPLIIKIHRDLLLDPKSDPDEIDKLDIGWKAPLDHIFSTHIPIIIGYGGNDGSLMDYFEKMNKPTNFFWCGLNKSRLSNKVKVLIEKHDGSFVHVDGFDELMHELLWVFDEIKPIKEELTEITNERIVIATKQLEEINAVKTINTKSTVNALEDKKKELSALEYKNLANKEPDLEKRKNIYLEALNKYPSTSWLWLDYTYFLHTFKKEYTNLDELYKKAIKLNENNSDLLNNYANFLQNIKNNYNEAEEYYLKALVADPNKATLNGNYANFLNYIKKDYKKAENYYLKALAVDPNNVNNNGNYATFLHEIKKDYRDSEEYYLKALAADPVNSVINGNYANYLKDIKKDYDRAEEHYLKALVTDPNDVNNNSNYATFLKNIRKDYNEAKISYIKALAADPINSNNNCNYAIFLKEITKDYNQAETYYLKALAVNPNSTIYNGNYAQLLLEQGRKEESEQYLLKAFDEKEANNLLIELWFYRYAHFPEFLHQAENKIEKLLFEGIRSIDWDFSGNINEAIKNNHPNPGRLKEFASKISTEY